MPQMADNSKSEDPITFRGALFAAVFILDWLAIKSALSIFGIPWLLTYPISIFVCLAPIVAPITAIYSLYVLHDWPWWSVSLVALLHLEYYSLKYARPERPS
jgi:hypothetical protein